MSVADSELLCSFWAVFTVMILLVFTLAIAVAAGLMWPKTFSLSDTLSAPSPVLPEIEKPADVLQNQSAQVTQVSWFLNTMASPFAPYLASQVKEAVTHSETPAAGASGQDATE